MKISDVTRVTVRMEGEVNAFWTMQLADGTKVECSSIDQESPYIEINGSEQKVYEYDETNSTRFGEFLQACLDKSSLINDVWDSSSECIEYTLNFPDGVIEDIKVQRDCNSCKMEDLDMIVFFRIPGFMAAYRV